MSELPMNLKKDLEYFSDLWAYKSKNRNYHNAEKWNERAKDWALELSENNEFQDSTNERVDATVAYLKTQGLLNKDDSVIDIGCGPGRFVSAFAKLCHYVVATDISPAMLSLAKEYTDQQNQANIDFVDCDFQEVAIDQQDWKGKFDLVFTSITPAIGTIECLEKVAEISRGWIFNSSFLKWQDSLELEIAHTVFEQDISPRRAHTHYYYALFNLLLLQGYFPKTEYFIHKRDEIMPYTDMITDYYMRIFSEVDINNKKEKITNFLKTKLDKDGNIRRATEKVYGWILWNANKLVKIL